MGPKFRILKNCLAPGMLKIGFGDLRSFEPESGVKVVFNFLYCSLKHSRGEASKKGVWILRPSAAQWEQTSGSCRIPSSSHANRPHIVADQNQESNAAHPEIQCAS